MKIPLKSCLLLGFYISLILTLLWTTGYIDHSSEKVSYEVCFSRSNRKKSLTRLKLFRLENLIKKWLKTLAEQFKFFKTVVCFYKIQKLNISNFWNFWWAVVEVNKRYLFVYHEIKLKRSNLPNTKWVTICTRIF